MPGDNGAVAPRHSWDPEGDSCLYDVLFGGFQLRAGVSGQTLQEVNFPVIVSVLVMVQGYTVNSFAPDAHKASKLTSSCIPDPRPSEPVG